MKLFRFAGLFVIALALFAGTSQTVQAGPPYQCIKYCDDEYVFTGNCSGTVAQCCAANHLCPQPHQYTWGNCYDNGVPICP